MKMIVFVIALAVVLLILARTSDAHLIRYPDSPSLSRLENREASQRRNLAHARYVCREGGGQHKRWACKARGWLERELVETIRARWAASVVARMVAAGEQVARESTGDPWPNCPDPHDGGGYTWTDTVKCENRGIYQSAGIAAAWSIDPPGFYCGPLQIDPNIWAHVIRRWGVPC